jgi:hypothetical protein
MLNTFYQNINWSFKVTKSIILNREILKYKKYVTGNFTWFSYRYIQIPHFWNETIFFSDQFLLW